MKGKNNEHLRHASIIFCLVAVFGLFSCADLTVNNVRSAPFLATSRAIMAVVKNEGGREAQASKTSFETAVDPSGPYNQIAEVPTAALGSGEEVDLFIAADPGRCVHVRICADMNDDVREGQGGEDNNCTVRSIGCD
jgi:hypothetical protein